MPSNSDSVRQVAISLLATAMLVCVPTQAKAQTQSQTQAQAFPNQPVKLIVPLTPGSGADIVARVLSKRLSEVWGQPVIVENRPGAGGQIGSQLVAKAPPDGYTLLVQSSSHAANPAIYKKLPYDPTQDFIDVALLATTPYVMLGSAEGPYKTVKDIIAAAKARPKGEPFASAGIGTSTHFTAEMFCQQAGIQMIHVPFKGSPDAISDVAGGRSLFYMAPLPTIGGMIKAGKVTALAVTSAKRAVSLPDVPALSEQGFAGFDLTLWFGLWAPAGTPAAIVSKLAADFTAAIQSPEVQEQYKKSGNESRLMTPAEFAAFVRSEMEVNKNLVRLAGIQPE